MFKTKTISTWLVMAEHFNFQTLMLTAMFSFFLTFSAQAADPPATFAHLVKKAGPSVVNVIVFKQSRNMPPGQAPYDPEEPYQDFFERFFKDRLPQEYRQGTFGSGFIIDSSGLILTNDHVVANASELRVRLSDDREFQATMVGRDTKTDLALIQIKTDISLPPLDFGDSDMLQVGDWVMAIGNPFGLGNTVTSGIVSAKYRQIGVGAYNNFIQTDAAVNPGNSGGPLLNMQGQVVGINSAFFSQTGSNVGIGFAIPINTAKSLLPQLRLGKVRRSYLGVVMQDITSDIRQALKLKNDGGALISDMLPNSPAVKAGLQRGDVIVALDGQKIKNSQELQNIISTVPIGKKILLEITRDSDTHKFYLKTEEMKDEELTASPDFSTLLGLSLQTMTPEIAKTFDLNRTKGILVTQVDENSPGMAAGLLPGDIILEAGRKAVNEVQSLNRIIEKSGRKKPILLLVDRDSRTLFVTVDLTAE